MKNSQVILISKIFFIGLLLQFFVETLFTFKFWATWIFWSGVWLWKELLIVWLGGFLVYRLRTTQLWKTIFDRLGLKRYLILLLGLVVFVFGLSLLTHTSLSTTIISLRYSVTGFFIFLIFALLAWQFLSTKDNIEWWYAKIISWLLWGSLIWRAIIYFIPRLLEFTWYSLATVEGDIWTAPPAVYYSQYNEWYPRNQFLFERPISRGFFLIAFWPLFFALFIKNRGTRRTFLRGGLYALAIFSTFSRAAWWAWMFQTVIIFFIEYRYQRKRILLFGGVPVVLLFGIAGYIWRDQIIKRQYSDTGHFTSVQLALEKIAAKPFLGQGAGSAWPASHHLGAGKAYNPENQFLQIWIEYGFFGFLGWIALYFWLHRIGFKARWITKHQKATKQEKYFWFLLFACSLWIAGLSICWLVLHSFVDRMIVYPFMAMFWLLYALFIKSRP